VGIRSQVFALARRLSQASFSIPSTPKPPTMLVSSITVWPKRGFATICVVLSVGVVFYAIRSYAFLKRLWASLRSGLVSGIGVIWFLASAAAFTSFNMTGHYDYLLFLGVAVIGTLWALNRDLKGARATDESLEADPDRPISAIEEDILGRGGLVTSIVRAIAQDSVPVVALTGSYGDGKSSVLNLLSQALDGRDDVLCVRFSTRLPMDDKTLISTLLSAIVESLETRLFVPNIKKNLVEFTRVLFAVLPGCLPLLRNLWYNSYTSCASISMREKAKASGAIRNAALASRRYRRFSIIPITATNVRIFPSSIAP